MPGPIAHGVSKALAEQRARRRPGPRPPASPAAGWAIFVLATLSFTWGSVGLIAEAWERGGDELVIRHWWASAFYALTMTWPPLLASWIARHWFEVPRPISGGLRWPRLHEIGLAIVVALGLGAIAILLARVAGEPNHVSAASAASSRGALAAVGAMLVLAVQAVGEEYGWRGISLTFAVERWGRVGIVMHGAAWGLSYAPLFVFAGPGPHDAHAEVGAFILTCVPLGIILSWLRLRSRSLVPGAIANAVLTIIAGLPLFLVEGSVGIRDAVFRWPGWVVLGLVAAIVLLTRKGELDATARARP